MTGCIDTYIRTNKAVVSDSYLSLIKHCKMEVGKESFPYADLLAIITIKRFIDDNFIVSNMTEKTLENIKRP